MFTVRKGNVRVPLAFSFEFVVHYYTAVIKIYVIARFQLKAKLLRRTNDWV